MVSVRKHDQRYGLRGSFNSDNIIYCLTTVDLFSKLEFLRNFTEFCPPSRNSFFLAASIISDPAFAAAALRAGQLVALPTETVYGLGANALDESAVAGIFAAKNRPSFDPLIIHQSTPERILAYAGEVPDAARKLADAFWPGPLTLVLPKSSLISDLVSAGLPTVALRVPDHSLIRSVLEQVDFPVAAPSANPFGFVSPTTASHVADQLGERIDYILDGGPCAVGLESTIVGFPQGKATVLRKGGLSIELIEQILGRAVALKTHSSSRPDAPGMLSKHYAPGNEVILRHRLSPEDQYRANGAAVIFGSRPKLEEALKQQGLRVYNLSPTGDLQEAARNLFSVLRSLHSGGLPHVYVELLPEIGLGRAINDRLLRAAATD